MTTPKNRAGRRMPEDAERLYARDAYGDNHLVGLRTGTWYQLGYTATWYKPEDCFSLTMKMWALISAHAGATLEVVDHKGKKPSAQRAYRAPVAELSEVAHQALIMGGSQLRMRIPREAFDVYDCEGSLLVGGQR